MLNTVIPGCASQPGIRILLWIPGSPEERAPE